MERFGIPFDMQFNESDSTKLYCSEYIQDVYKSATGAFTRKIMGYHLSDNMEYSKCIKSIRMTINNRKTNTKLIYHSDRSSQHCAIYDQLI